MRIDVSRKANCAGITIEPGEYSVTISPETNRIVLSGMGVNHHLPATRRPAKKPVKRITTYYGPSIGDSFWVISCILPPRTEWFSILKLGKASEEESEDEE
jgi:hypothetical protein